MNQPKLYTFDDLASAYLKGLEIAKEYANIIDYNDYTHQECYPFISWIDAEEALRIFIQIESLKQS